MYLGNVHDGSFPGTVSSKEAGYFSLAEFQSKVIHRHDLALIAVVHLPHAVESHSRLLLVYRQTGGVALFVCIP